MSDQEEDRRDRPHSSKGNTNAAGGAASGGTGRSPGKASPDEVIGKRRPTARLNKRLVLGVVAGIAVLMLVLNFLPSSGKGNGSADSEGSVYANDAMPQDVREMALKLPEVNPSTAAVGRTGSAAGTDVFAGYTSSQSVASQNATSVPANSSSSRDYQGMAATDARLEAEQAARRAPMEVPTRLTAALSGSSTNQSSGSGSTTGETSLLANGGVPTASFVSPVPLAATGLSPSSTYTPGQVYRDFNDQASKVAFSQQTAGSGEAEVGRLADPTLLPYTIFAGTIVAAALQTAINTDLPGDVLATVSENVFDTVSGRNLLIPQGSRLLANYSSSISFGQKKVQVAWQRLIRPDGVSISLSNMNGVDPQGMSGYPGWVDQHWWEYAKGIGLMALFSIIDGQLQYSMKTANSQGVSDIANSVTAGIDQVGTQFTANVLNVQPTITVKQGAKVQVFVNRDIILPPAQQKEVLKKYAIANEEGGSK